MALAEIVTRKPDMVIGGINHGDNASVNAHYSGTMGVTLEGCMKYIPSVAFSLCDHREDADFEPLRHLVRQITERVLTDGLPTGVCLNVNFPLVSGYKGVRVCRMAHGTWGNEVTKCHHPRGYDYWWMVGCYTNDEPEAEDTDNWALTHGFVAITPTQIDLTAYSAMELIRSWDLNCKS
jgi:5'-nucleotidase